MDEVVQSGTRNDDLVSWSQLNKAMDVRQLMTPREEFFTCACGLSEEKRREALLEAKQLGYDVIPLSDGKIITGYFTQRCVDEAQLGIDRLLSANTPIPELIDLFVSNCNKCRGTCSLTDCTCKNTYFILSTQQVIGLVTTADLNKLPARIFLYNLVGEVELALAKLIERMVTLTDDEVIRILREYQPRNLTYHANELEKARNSNVGVSILQQAYLSDLIAVIETHSDLFQTVCGSQKMISGQLQDLTNLRNTTMHPSRPILVSMPKDIQALHHRVTLAKKILTNCRDHQKHAFQTMQI